MAKQVTTITKTFVVPAGPAGYYNTEAVDISGYNAFSVQVKPNGTTCGAAVQFSGLIDESGMPVGWIPVYPSLVNGGGWNSIPNPLPSPYTLPTCLPARYLCLAFQNANPGATIDYVITLRE